MFTEWNYLGSHHQPVGIGPFKLGHIAFHCPDVAGGGEVLREGASGFRVSDWIEDWFVFMRCNADHHTLNFIVGDQPEIHHIAFELKDMSHLQNACEMFALKKIPLLWGPVRPRPGPQRRHLSSQSRRADGRALYRAQPDEGRGARIFRAAALASRHAAISQDLEAHGVHHLGPAAGAGISPRQAPSPASDERMIFASGFHHAAGAVCSLARLREREGPAKREGEGWRYSPATRSRFASRMSNPPDCRRHSARRCRRRPAVRRGCLLDDAAVIQHHQAVHARDRRQPVRDGDHGAALHQRPSCSWIAASISESSAEVASSSTRIGASFRITRAMRDALALAARQLDAALADMRVVAAPPVPVLELEDEVVRLGARRAALHLVARDASGRP